MARDSFIKLLTNLIKGRNQALQCFGLGGWGEEDPCNEKGTRQNLITESLPGTRLSEIVGGCDFEGKQSLKSCYNVYNATIRCGGEYTDGRADRGKYRCLHKGQLSV